MFDSFPSAFARRRAPMAMGLLLSASALMAGCTATGGSSTPNSNTSSGAGTSNQPATSIDPCSVITQAEATTALGSDPGPGTKSDGVHCVYAVGGTDPGKSASVTVAVFPNASRKDFDALKNAGNVQGVSKVQDVSGIGEAAFASIGAAGGAGGSMEVLKGPHYLDIMFGSYANPDAPVLDILTALAKTAVGRV